MELIDKQNVTAEVSALHAYATAVENVLNFITKETGQQVDFKELKPLLISKDVEKLARAIIRRNEQQFDSNEMTTDEKLRIRSELKGLLHPVRFTKDVNTFVSFETGRAVFADGYKETIQRRNSAKLDGRVKKLFEAAQGLEKHLNDSLQLFVKYQQHPICPGLDFDGERYSLNLKFWIHEQRLSEQ